MSILHSKSLEHDDTSGFNFAKEMLDGDETSAINFDRLQFHPKNGYILFEYLLCEEEQSVNPWSSHPRRYWDKNKTKFISLWKVTKALNATLYLVNYAKKGTLHEDKILLIEVQEIDNNGITGEIQTKMSRSQFQKWFRKLNNECLGYPDTEKRYYINCPYSEKEEAKQLGAKYDGNLKSWYYTNKDDEYKFKKWLTSKFL